MEINVAQENIKEEKVQVLMRQILNQDTEEKITSIGDFRTKLAMRMMFNNIPSHRYETVPLHFFGGALIRIRKEYSNKFFEVTLIEGKEKEKETIIIKVSEDFYGGEVKPSPLKEGTFSVNDPIVANFFRLGGEKIFAWDLENTERMRFLLNVFESRFYKSLEKEGFRFIREYDSDEFILEKI